MITENELEERITDMLDKQQEDVRKAILSLEIEQAKKAIEQAKKVAGK